MKDIWKNENYYKLVKEIWKEVVKESLKERKVKEFEKSLENK